MPDLPRKYTSYLTDSSFHGALEFKKPEKVREYLSGIYHTIVMKDVVARLNVGDVLMLESLIKFRSTAGAGAAGRHRRPQPQAPADPG